MVWFQVDDTLAYHAKVRNAGNAAMGLWVRAGAWSAQTLTDGFIPNAVARSIGTQSQAERLIKANLWRRVPGGYQFHQWDRQQISKAEIEARREAERLRKAEQRKRKNVPQGHRPDVPPGVPDDVPPDVQEESHWESERESLACARALPNPAPPFPSSNGHFEEISNGELDKTAPPRKVCSKHIDNPDPPPCHGCRQAREQHETWEAGQASVAAELNAAFWREVADCTDCDERGWIEADDEGFGRCPNHDWSVTHA